MAHSVELAWHYTTGQKFLQIAETGYLIPTDAYISNGERPILWFSRHQFWEPTANKGIASSEGFQRTATMIETFNMGGGLARFGVLPSRLVEWPKIGRQARMPAEIMKGLEAAGLEKGANPTHWLGSLKKIRIKECRIHVMSEDCSAWVPVQGPGV